MFADHLITTQLNRILESATFRHSGRMQRFLRFTVERVLAGEAASIKEYLLGVEVFDRQPSFDPRSDSVVRVEARRLRTKLEEYYAVEGRGDPIHIGLPKGCYVPCFTANLPAPGAPPRLPRWYTAAAVVGAVAIALMLWTAYKIGRYSAIHDGITDEHSIAVLPFVDRSDRKDQEALCDGLVDELTHAVVQIPGIRVPAHSAIRSLGNVGPEKIGHRLKVAYLLQGSVQKQADRYRITVELVRVSDSLELWSQSFDGDSSDWLALETRIGRGVAGRLSNTFAPHDSDDPQVRDLYLLGRFYTNKMTPSTTRRAIDYFEQALQRDPNCTRAYAGLADAYDLAYLFDALPTSRASVEARTAALRAVALDDSLGEAHAALARHLMWVDADWSRAEHELRRAINLDPHYAEAYQIYAWNLAFRGRYSEALEAIHQAVVIDPLSPRIRNVEAMLMLLARRYDDAVDVAHQAIELDPSYGRAYQTLGRALVKKGAPDDAIPAMVKSVDLGSGGGKALLGWAYACAGQPAAARSMLRKLSTMAPTSAYGVAEIHAALGERDAAFQWLERALRAHEFLGELIAPEWDSLRPDPRYPELLKKIGLTPVPPG